MSTQPALPEPIASYFRTKGSAQPDEVLVNFSPDAVIFDTGENMEMVGHDAIRKWLSGTIATYDLTTEVISFTESDEETVVTAKVSGNFPGSPIDFDYRFTLQDEKIKRLVIE